MASSISETPLLLATHDDNAIHNTDRWWNKILDVDEAKHQLMFSLPMILTNLFYYLITLVSVMLVGHLGELQLAGSTLANSWFSVTGGALMVIYYFFYYYFLFSLTEPKGCHLIKLFLRLV